MATYPTAQQASAVYTLTNPAGDIAVFNDQSSPNYVGALVGEEAVSGLDSPEVRNAIYDMVEADGAILGPQYHGMRPVVLQPSILADSVASRNEMESRLRRVVNGCMRGDGTLAWTPDGSIEQFVTVRKYQRLQIKGGWRKDAMVSLVSGFPYIQSTALRTQTAAFNTDQVIENQGEEFGPPALIRINGPSSGSATGPTIRRTYDSVAYELALPGLVVASGTYIDIDPWDKTIVTSAGASAYSSLSFNDSTWWALGPGNNTVRLEWDSGTTTGSTFRIDWRDTWL